MNDKLLILFAAMLAIGALLMVCAASPKQKRTLIPLANTKLDLIPLVNEGLPRWSADMPAGTVCLANEARLTSRYYSEPLTTYLTGWQDPNNIEDTLNFLAPPVQVGRRFEFKKQVNAEEFYSETDDLRTIGSAFKRVEYAGTSQNEKTLNKGLTFRADHDEYADVPGWRENTVRKLKQRILRNELRRIVTAVAAAANNTAKTWDTTAGKDPDQDVLTELIAAVDVSGVRPNRLLYGDVAWNKRSIALRAQNLAGQATSSTMTREAVAGFLGVDEIRVSKERYQTGAAAKGKVVPDIVLFFYAENDPGI